MDILCLTSYQTFKAHVLVMFIGFNGWGRKWCQRSRHDGGSDQVRLLNIHDRFFNLVFLARVSLPLCIFRQCIFALASVRMMPVRLEDSGFSFAYPRLDAALRHLYGKKA